MNIKNVKTNWVKTNKLGIFFLFASLLFAACNEPKELNPSRANQFTNTQGDAAKTVEAADEAIVKAGGFESTEKADAAIDALFAAGGEAHGLDLDGLEIEDAKTTVALKGLRKDAVTKIAATAGQEKGNDDEGAPKSDEVKKARAAATAYKEAATALRKAIEAAKANAVLDPDSTKTTTEGDQELDPSLKPEKEA